MSRTLPERQEGPGAGPFVSRSRLLPFLLLSALLHLPLIEFLFLLGGLRREGPVTGTPLREITQVMLVDPAEAERHRREAEEEERRKERERERIDGQVVDLSEGAVEAPPLKETRFLSDRNSRAEKETRKYGKPGPRQESPISRAAPEEARREPAAGEEPARAGTPASPPKEEGGRPDDGIEPPRQPAYSLLRRDERRLRVDDRVARDLGRLDLRREEEAEGPSRSRAPDRYEALLPPMVGGSGGGSGNGGTSDYLPGVEEGEATLLNTRQFKYHSFFRRMKERLEEHWVPRVASAFSQRDPTGKVYGVRDRLTVLHVTLDGDGSVRDVLVVDSSGLDFLDREAVEAFRQARSFPNPPPGLKDENGLIPFYFGFFVERSAEPGIRFFRYGP